MYTLDRIVALQKLNVFDRYTKLEDNTGSHKYMPTITPQSRVKCTWVSNGSFHHKLQEGTQQKIASLEASLLAQYLIHTHVLYYIHASTFIWHTCTHMCMYLSLFLY